jgi:hypothetical protein
MEVVVDNPVTLVQLGDLGELMWLDYLNGCSWKNES